MGIAGQKIGDDRYELIRDLGSGAFGNAFEAKDLDEDDRVAVKLLNPGVTPDDVLREAQLHRRLSRHPRIVAMRNVLVAAVPSPFVVLDYVPGGSLQYLLQTRRPSVVEAQRWLRDVLEALAHAHTSNVLHRDVKPSNLLVGVDGHVMLTDFGVAEDSVRRVATAPGMYPLTMPPEFVAGAPTTEQTDLWLVGVLGWQLLVGHRPDLALAYAGTLELPHRRSLEVPIALSRAVMEALVPDPSGRPSSAERMLERIAAVPVKHGWSDMVPADPSIVRQWESDAGAGRVQLRIRRRSRDFEVVATAAPGSRLRSRRRVTAATLAGARAQARKWLEQVVRGEPL